MTNVLILYVDLFLAHQFLSAYKYLLLSSTLFQNIIYLQPSFINLQGKKIV